MQIEFFGPSVRDSDNKQGEAGRLYNCHRSPKSDGTFALRAVLGMTSFATLTGAIVRATGVIEGIPYVVFGGALWTFTSAGTATSLGTIPDSAETTISGNNGKVTVCANGRYFVYDPATLAITEPTTGAFSDFGSVEFLGQRTVLTERSGRRLQWSDLLDPETLGGTDFATTESRDDDNIRAMCFGPELWVFKQTSIERWYASAAGLQVINGATIDKGIKAFGLLAKLDTGGFFIANDGKAYLVAAGGAIQRVSGPAVETSIAQDEPQTCFVYQDEGHEFCVITFRNRPAWCFDVTTGEWHERGEGDLGAWSARLSVRAYGNWYALDDLAGVYRLTRSNVDASGPLIRDMWARTVSADFNRFRAALVEIPVTSGVDGIVELRTSGDRGLQWSAPKPRSVGAVGHYLTRAVWRSLGQFRALTVRLTVSDAVEITPDSMGNLVVA